MKLSHLTYIEKQDHIDLIYKKMKKGIDKPTIIGGIFTGVLVIGVMQYVSN